MKNYVANAYSVRERPVTEYPAQLARYLSERFCIPNDAKILDNGCGRGDYLRAFSRLGGGYTICGTDIDGSGNDVWKVDLEHDRLPFDDDFFDMVFSKSVMEHLYRAENYLDEMRRVLKRGGRLILMVPDWETQNRIFYDDPTHVHPYTRKSVKKLLEIQGYTDIGVERFCQLPGAWKHPHQMIFVKMLQLLGPVKKTHRNKFIRFARELMILGVGIKRESAEAMG
jgi:SAM-dependent methyltransferase